MAESAALCSQPHTIAVLGWPVGHSLSPVMHNAALQAAGINACYIACAVPPDRVGEAVLGLRGLGFIGANVTLPHKETVLPYLDEIESVAAALGAVNTIAVREGRLIGANTDGAGFLAHLRHAGHDPAGWRCVVLGAGGAARAVAAALAGAGAAGIAVLSRTVTQADAVAALARSLAPQASDLAVVAAGPNDDRACRWLAGANLVVNCTPVGMAPRVAESPLPNLAQLPAGAVVYDTVYRPRHTQLLAQAQARGLTAIGGLGMLVHQGARSWQWWFGREGPVDKMWAAADAALGALGEGPC